MTQLATDRLNSSISPSSDSTQDKLTAMARQFETEFHQSEVYRQAMGHLQSLPEQSAKQMQTLVRIVSRAAIQHATRRAASQDMIPPPPPPLPPSPLAAPTPLSRDAEPAGKPAESGAGGSEHRPRVVEQAPPPARSQGGNKLPSHRFLPLRKAHSAEVMSQMLAQERTDRLKQLGQTLQQARQAKAISLRQLHTETLVPVHQLEALELGWVDRLPEDIYIRGFIQRVSKALGLDGASLIASLPTADPINTVLPSWYQPTPKSHLTLNSLQLYLGYAALMAGGVAWLSQQGLSQEKFYPEIKVPEESTLQPSPSPQVNQSTQVRQPDQSDKQSNLTSSTQNKGGGKAGKTKATVSPPESMRNR